MLQAAFDVVDEDFEVRAGPPPEDIAKHTRAIIEHTLLRTMDQTSGTVLRHKVPEGDGPSVVDELATDVPFNRRLVGTGLLARFLNGDPRKRKIIHWCRGCCNSPEESRENVKTAIAHGGILGGFASTTPSKSRHGSVTESLGEQTAGSMFHEILPRAAAKAFATWERCDVVLEEEEDKRIYMKRKTWRARQHLTSQRSMQRGAMISWVAEPMDHLWMKLQYLDARTSLMLDLQLPRASPFEDCLRDLSSTLLLPISEGP